MINLKKGFLNGNALKIIAAVTMVIDHIGAVFGALMTPEMFNLFRGIGRLSFPLFAFLIAEGCRYTKDRRKYFLSLFLLGLICNIVYYVAMDTLYLCVLTTFSLSVLLIYSYDGIVNSIKAKDGNLLYNIIKLVAVISVAVLASVLCDKLGGMFDYGIPGVVFPLLAYVIKNKWLKLIPIALGMIGLCLNYAPFSWGFNLQLLGFISLVLIALYNGERGKCNLKNFFYLFYPIHLLLLEGLYILYLVL